MPSKPNPPTNPDPNNPSPFPSPAPQSPAIAAVTSAAQRHGQQLRLPADLDGSRLMLAIAMNESSLGRNVGPRHEPAYDVGGSVWQSNLQQQALVRQYGSDAACSYGPWQMMFINFGGGITPDQLHDVDLCAQEFVRFFNSYVIRSRQASTLEQIAQVWNGGHVFHPTPPPGVQAYVDRLKENYGHFTA